MGNLIERTVLLTNKDSQGNTTMDFPITKIENVEGAEDLVKNVMQAVEQVQTQIGNIKDTDTWGLPDYNSAITLSTSQFPYTVPRNGVIYQAATDCTLYVNGKEANYNGTAGGSSCFVSKGDIVTRDGSFVRCYFYPLKGVSNA